MNVEESFDTEHLLLTERKCRVCGEVKDLMNDFYKIRKKRYDLISSYAYECKSCTVKRITESRKKKPLSAEWQYPDW